MLRWADEHGVELAPELVRVIRDGFGGDASGEDPFDAYVGAAGMVASVLGLRPHEAPATPQVTALEGWIFGRRRQ